MADRDIVRRFVQDLLYHGRYTNDFETFYITSTREYYAEEAEQKFQQHLKEPHGALFYLRHAHRRREQELARCDAVLPQSSRGDVIQTVDEAMLNGKVK